MKQIALLILSITMINITVASPGYEFDIQPHWQNLEKDSKNSTLFGSLWIWAATITFKKRPKDEVFLNTITLTWKGQHIRNLTGTLFKKEPSKPFLPLENNLISDGAWNAYKQTLTFRFKQKEKLHPTDIFCLVLTIPLDLEKTIKQGSFTIEQETLPLAFRNPTSEKIFSLSYHQMVSTKEQNN